MQLALAVLALAAYAPHAVAGASINLRRAPAALRLTHKATLESNNSSALVEVSRDPVRIARSGAEAGSGKHLGYDSEDSGHAGHDDCFVSVKVHSGADKTARCPDACPFYAEDLTHWDFCRFVCVPDKACTRYNAHTPIADKEAGVCRSCIVDGCETCDSSVNVDRCAKCEGGYYLKDGECYWEYGGAWVNVVLGVIAGLFALILVWLVEWLCSPTINQVGLEKAQAHRERTKLKTKKDDEGRRHLFPLTTNLCREQVAGPGMTLHFNFQVFLMIWAVFVASVWMFFAIFVDADLWRLGTRSFGTPRTNCYLVMWGYERQQTLMWTKVAFLWIVYIGSFLMCMIYGMFQLRRFQAVDYESKTMKDFVALIVGLPKISGTEDVEQNLKRHLEHLTGQSLVGVSVAWDWQEHEETIQKALAADLQERAYLASGEPPDEVEVPPMKPVRSFFYKMERKLFGLDAPEEIDENEAANVDELLLELRTSSRAFAVFETQQAKEEAVESLKDGFEFAGASGITMEEIDAEPDTVQWVHFGHSTKLQKIVRLCIGMGCIMLACAFWGVVFYAPYAFYVMTFNYENGRQPGLAVAMSFTMIVVIGNAIMYEVCEQISDRVGFQYKNEKEACYMIIHTIACGFNVLLDFVTTYYTAAKVVEGLGFRTYFGVPLTHIKDYTAKFETYGMQRSLGENAYNYAFPSTFLIPFLIEPLAAVILPWLIGRQIVRTHPEVQGIAAEEWYEMQPMGMGRYADLLLNAILGIMIFYFPGGYSWMMFLAMAASHLWVYVFDHYRLLRAVPACTFAAYDIEWWAQAMLAPIVGIIFACLVFKTNCESYSPYCTTGPPLIVVCAVGWFVHTLFHYWCLKVVVPKFSLARPEEDVAAHETFASLATRLPCSWFTSNPIWCLRSKYKYKHFPPCSYHKLGNEQLIRVNEEIGCYYDEKDEALFDKGKQ